jgi:hypothetical protein
MSSAEKRRILDVCSLFGFLACAVHGADCGDGVCRVWDGECYASIPSVFSPSLPCSPPPPPAQSQAGGMTMERGLGSGGPVELD